MKRMTQWLILVFVTLTGLGVGAATPVTTLPENRFLDFNDYALTNNGTPPTWVHDGNLLAGMYNRQLLQGTNHFHRAGWTLNSVRAGAFGYQGLTVPPLAPLTLPAYPVISSNLAANLRNDLYAYVESPVLTNGLGTLYFETINGIANTRMQVTVDVATNMVLGNYIWNSVDVIDVSAVTTNDFYRYSRLLSYRQWLKFRIRRSDSSSIMAAAQDSNYMIVDNIRASSPPADVLIYDAGMLHQSGSVALSCYISNVDTNAPATNRIVTAYCRWLDLSAPANAWTNLPMTLVSAGDGLGNGEKYSVTLPAQPLASRLEYYVGCAFDGYWFSSPDYTGRGYTNYASECRSPETTGALTNSYAGSDKYNLAVASGTGGGAYSNGQQVAIAASNIIGKAFYCWTGATGYVSNAFSASTLVTMPASDIALAATYTNLYYSLVVSSGSGSGAYTSGQQVTIAADAPVAGKIFYRWTGDVAYVSSVTSSTAIVTMPATNINVTATYLDVYDLVVNDGVGGGSYTNGQQIAITANTPSAGQIFYRWTGDTAYLSSVTSATAVVTMPAMSVTVTATYIDVYTLTVNSGSGGGSYTNGQQVTVTAAAPAPGKIFSKWTGATAYLSSVTSATAVVTMPAFNIAVTATYVDVYTLTVGSGSGSGAYVYGQQVAIVANTPALGMTFYRWTGDVVYVENALSPSTSVSMPAATIAVAATYSNLYYRLTVVNGSGSGVYTNGQNVGISADLSGGKVFSKWVGSVAYVANASLATTTVTMPTSDITVMAMTTSQTNALPESRYLDFNDYALTNNGTPPTWTHEGNLLAGLYNRQLLQGTNHYHRTGWSLISCRAGAFGYQGLSVPPLIPSTVPAYPAIASNLAANLRNDNYAYIESPVFTNGVGTLYFDAINGIANISMDLIVSVATNAVMGTNGLEYAWFQVGSNITLNASATDQFYRYSYLFNYRQWMKIRIQRASTVSGGQLESNFLVVDNIRVSIPPSDVTISKTDCPFDPGYPGINSNVTVRCYVSDVDTNVPTDSRYVQIVYRWRYLNQQIGAWRTNDMIYVSGTGSGSANSGSGCRYTATLPPFPEIGDLEYYFVCSFGGYVFQSPDCTGTGLTGTPVGDPGVYPYQTENLSPRYLRSTGAREYYFRLRPYASKYSALYAVTDQNASPIAMSLTGDNEWRAMVPVGATGITNLTWRFMGVGAYEVGAENVSTDTVYWTGLSGVIGGNVPYGGYCITNGTDSSRLTVGINSGAYAMLTLNTETLQYMANRAEYQNFNYWPAPLDLFTESNGQVEKQYFPQTFDSWPTNEDQTYSEPFVLSVTEPSSYSVSAFSTHYNWLATSAKYVVERAFDTNPLAVLDSRNKALRMKGGDGDLGLGYVQNTDNNLPDGFKQITFKARAGQTADNYDVVYRRDGFSLANYLVRSTFKATDAATLSPENPSLSIVAYYQDPGNFYEFRITQVTNTVGTLANPQDVRVLYQLFKWQNGTASQLTSAYASLSVSAGYYPLMIPNDSYPVEMRLYTSGSSTLIRCKFNAWDNVLVYTDNSSAFTMGTYGFMSAECKAQIANVIIQPTISGAVGSGTITTTLGTGSTFDSDVTSWYYPTNRYKANNSVSPKGIYSVLPTQALGLYLQPTNSTSWTLAAKVYVTNFTYQPYTITCNSWQSEYAKLQVMGGDADVAVDELCVYSWHGKTVPTGYTTTGWRGTEAWVVSNNVSGGNYVQLDHSRANPSLAQSVRSLLLTNGMGVLEFDYRIIRAPAKVTVQYAYSTLPNTWYDIESIIVSNVTGWTHASGYLGLSQPGYLRVLNERSGGYTNAWVDIDNVTAWDEPFVTNTSWKVYNAKITQTDTNRVFLDETKACFLNNSTTLEASPPQVYFQPYLQSPTLPKGLGTLSFLARAYTNNETATLYLYASTNGWGAATNQWFWLDNYTFTITNTLYHLYTYAPAGGLKNINAIRLMTSTAVSAKRVCLDEVSIAEPILPGFDIVNVKLLSYSDNTGSYTNNSQPLAGEDVDVEARVANQQLIPSNIAMYVSYYVGTNTWGVGNWPSASVVTRRMFPVAGDSTLYRTQHSDDGSIAGLDPLMVGPIKEQDADVVVQYYVWANYDGGAPTRLTEQQDTFENPSWYYPVDLNVRYVAKGWSPYYYVYNVRRNAVWINEVNATDYKADGSGNKISGVWDNRYIEIAVPAWLDLAGWSVDLVTSSGYSTRTITIPSGLGTHTADTNGYYFFVIYDAYNYNSSLPRMDFGYANLSSYIPYLLPGGLRLKRPLGMYEQTIAYDWNSAYGDSFNGTLWATNDPEKRFVYVGRENNDGSLSKTGICSADTPDNTNTWYFPKTWTPGAPNQDQTISVSGDSLQPGVSNIWITSLFTLLKGTQNDKRIQTYIIKTRSGMATNINYQIDAWYRLYSLQANNSEVLSSAEQSTGVRNYNLEFSNLTNDISITANVLLRKDLAEYEDDPNILAWIMGFTDGDLVPSYTSTGGGWAELSMTEKYWLDLNPTITNYFSFPQAGPLFDSVNTNVFLTISMSVSNGLGGAQAVSSSALQGNAVLKLRAKQNLSDPEWTLVRQYSLNDSSFGSNNVCHVFVPDPFAVLISGMTPSSCFFSWLIEMDDPRVQIEPLTNSTANVVWPVLP